MGSLLFHKKRYFLKKAIRFLIPSSCDCESAEKSASTVGAPNSAGSAREGMRFVKRATRASRGEKRGGESRNDYGRIVLF